MTTYLSHLHLSPPCSCSSILPCSPGQSPRHHAVIAPRVSALLGRTYLKLLYRVRKAKKFLNVFFVIEDPIILLWAFVNFDKLFSKLRPFQRSHNIPRHLFHVFIVLWSSRCPYVRVNCVAWKCTMCWKCFVHLWVYSFDKILFAVIFREGDLSNSLQVEKFT